MIDVVYRAVAQQQPVTTRSTMNLIQVCGAGCLSAHGVARDPCEQGGY